MLKNILQDRPKRGSPIYFNKSYKLIQDIEHSKITYEEALKIISNIRIDIKRLNDLADFKENQIKVVNALFMVNGKFNWYEIAHKGYVLRSKSNKKESDKELDEESDEESTLENEEIDTTDMSDLENEESAARIRNQQGKGLKVLTPSQMLSRLPISLAPLKAGNNSEKRN